jgi:predicted nuclease of predicted toxin-antitoxin system
MRFLVDECTGPAVSQYLRALSHEVFSVYEEARGMADDEILIKAHSESWIVVTHDRDFGEMIFRENRPHRGVVFLRLRDERAPSKIAAIERVLASYEDRLADEFVVVTDAQVRFGKP